MTSTSHATTSNPTYIIKRIPWSTWVLKQHPIDSVINYIKALEFNIAYSDHEQWWKDQTVRYGYAQTLALLLCNRKFYYRSMFLLNIVPFDERTLEICKIAVVVNIINAKHVPEHLLNDIPVEFWACALARCYGTHDYLQYVPKQFQTDELWLLLFTKYHNHPIIQPSECIQSHLFSWRKYIPPSSITSEFVGKAMEMNSDVIKLINLDKYPELHDRAYALNPIYAFMSVQHISNARMIEVLHAIKTSTHCPQTVLLIQFNKLYMVVNDKRTQIPSGLLAYEDVAKACIPLNPSIYTLLSESLRGNTELLLLALNCMSHNKYESSVIIKNAPPALLSTIDIPSSLLLSHHVFRELPEEIKRKVLPEVISNYGIADIKQCSSSNVELFNEPCMLKILLNRLSQVICEQFDIASFTQIISRHFKEIRQNDECMKLVVDMYLRYIRPVPFGYGLSFKTKSDTFQYVIDQPKFLEEVDVSGHTLVHKTTSVIERVLSKIQQNSL